MVASRTNYRQSSIVTWCLASIIVLLVAGDQTQSNDTKTKAPTASLTYPGDIYIGVFVDLHRSSSNRSQPALCGELNPAAVQQMWSAIWAVDTLNNQTEPGMPKLGLKVYDTCDNALIALKQAIGFLRNTVGDFPSSCDHHLTAAAGRPSSLTTMLGVIGIGEAAALKPILGLLQVYSVPLVLATPSAASGLPPQSNVLTTAPTMASLVQALVSLITELHFKSIYALTTSPAASQDLATSIVNREGITIVQAITLTSSGGINSDVIEGIVTAKKVGNQRVFVLMLEPNEIDRLVEALAVRLLPSDNSIWVVATPSMDKQQVVQWGSVLKRGFIVTPHPIYLQEFRSSFLSALSGRAKGRPVAINNYLRRVYDCMPEDTAANKTSEKHQEPCSTLSYADLQKGFHQDPSVPFVSKAVSALAASLRLVQIGRCPELGTRCVSDGLRGSVIFEEIMEALMKLSFTIQGNEPMEVEGTRLKFTEDGKLLFKHFDIYAMNGSSHPIQVGWYSDNIGLNLNVAWRQQSGATRLYHTLSELEVTETSEGSVRRPDSTATGRSLINVLHFSDVGGGGGGRGGWPVTAIIVTAAIGIFMTFYVFIYMVVKIWDRTLNGNQFLAILLLFGVISLYATCFVYVMPPSEAGCHWRLFLQSVSYALCYGVLLVKVMQLRSLVTIGLGGRISHLNQAITLFFIVGLQIALNVQWSILRRPAFGFSDEFGDFRCLVSRTDFVCLQSYVLLLLFFVCGYSIYTRHIQRNDNEGRWILLASFFSVPAWVTWMTTYLYTDVEEYADLVVCAGLLFDATVVVGTVFLPKLRTLSGQTSRSTPNGCSSSHADISSTNSTTTVFSLDGVGGKSLGGGGGCGGKVKSFPSSLFAESLLRNPLYDFRDKRMHAEKKLHSIAENVCEK